MSISVCLDLVMRNLMASSLGIRRQGRAHCHPLLSLCHPPWFSTLREVHRLQLPPPNHDRFCPKGLDGHCMPAEDVTALAIGGCSEGMVVMLERTRSLGV
ncbi:unnamed protein product [Durusdinium trenchii]|uniref:Uncharacterized protein n=1 Tax=Durusdinium trenchii TaxID=1381693 RepID=A0ABP0HCP7_9DINO